MEGGCLRAPLLSLSLSSNHTHFLFPAVAPHSPPPPLPSLPLNTTTSSIRGRFEKLIRQAQLDIVAAIEEEDGVGKFQEDAWAREGGGGGVSRVMQDGAVWEKAGVGVSVVYGTMPPDAYRAATGEAIKAAKADPAAGGVPFFAAGISSVMHPHNPHAPTMHFNYRYFETEEWCGVPGQWWFGGGTDITPAYVDEADMAHFHGTYKAVCDKHDPAFYPKFKKWADEYFWCAHRGQTRGLGGIFFDDLNDRDPDTIMKFSADALHSVIPAYRPIVARHKNDPYTEAQKDWQGMRRGLYAEYNLVYDRGTTFGLKTAGRVESILMSLPLRARWEYCHEPAPGSPEAELLKATRTPREWV
jgi:coproporphyrinogen III oxidase